MIKLMHNNVDGYMNCRAEFEYEPTMLELAYHLSAYHDDDVSLEVAKTLLSQRSDVDVPGSMSCDVYSLV